MYNPKAVYTFIDENGNRVYSNGDNGYIRDAYENGLGLSFDENGNWFTRPYIKTDGNSITAVMPEWFLNTAEYQDWTDTYVPQIKNRTLTDETISSIKKTLSSLGELGATRQSLRNEAKNMGLFRPEDQERYANDITAVAVEGSKKGTANLNFSSLLTATESSATDIARAYKNLSKEELSSQMNRIYDILEQSSNGTYKGSTQDVLEAAELSRILNYIDENHTQYGEDGEFKGLLEPSQWQRFQAGIAANMANLTYNSIFGIPTRVIDKMAENWWGGDLIPNTYEAYLSELAKRPIAGGSLGNLNQLGNGSKNTEGDISWGNFIGSLEIIGATVGMTMAGQAYVQGGLMSAAPGTAMFNISRIIDAGGVIANTLITDFVMNDLPMDVFLLLSDADQYGWDKALYDPENPQNLWGIPFISIRNGSLVNEYGVPNLSGFGPEVPGGFLFNVLGDLTLDFAPKIISTTLGGVDNLTGGYLARAKQKVADVTSVANFRLQTAVEKIPIVGDSIKKTVNFFVGTSDANMVRTAKKTAVAKNDPDWYVKAQQVLTQQNHGGYEAVFPKFKKILEDTGVTKWIDFFTKNKDSFGGIKKRSVSVQDVEGGEKKVKGRTVKDVLPDDVRNGLLDIQRLAELQGEKINEGGLPFNSARETEIAELEERVQNLPQEIKDFAAAFHEANIRVNKMIEDLGLRPEGVTEKWMEDPRFDFYMVRQTLTPYAGPEGRVGSPDEPKILSESRTGVYDRAHQVDPTTALALKVEAIGKAWAYNERKKFVAAMAEANGNLVAGGSGVKAATKLSEVKTQIQDAQVMRDMLGYDAVLSKFNANADTVNSAFKRINELFRLPDTINAKSVFSASQDPDVKAFKLDFTSGKISFAEGLDKAGLGDADLADVMNNTFRYNPTQVEGEVEAGKFNGAGVTNEGVPYLFDVEDGKVTSIRKAETTEELADSVRGLSGAYDIDDEVVKQMGATNLYAVNRTLMFYRENLPEIAERTIFRLEHEDPGVYGWCKIIPSDIKFEDGKITVPEWEVFVNHSFYDKGKESHTMASVKGDVQSGYHPKNSIDLSNTFIHENGHSMMGRLSFLEMNQKIAEGSLKDVDQFNVSSKFYEYRAQMQEEILYNAMKRMGIDGPDGNHQKLMDQRKTISRYAWDSSSYGTKNSETIAEAMVDYAFNGQNASPFSQAIVAEIQERLAKFSTVASPKEALEGNGLKAPKGLLKGESFAFPDNVKTKAQQAKWLDRWRKKNPYLTTTPIMVDGRDYAKNVTADNTKNIEGYKQFASDHMQRVPETELGANVEDFALHVIRPGGDVDMYNSYLRGGDYDSVKDWSRHYIDDVEDMYADDIEDLAFQFFPEDAEKISKEYEVDFDKKGYWDTMINYQDALKNMMADKLLQATKGNYELNDSSIFYRGVSTEGNHVNRGGDFSWLKEGKKFKDDGFGFVSLSDVVAENYASHGSGNKYILEYHVPAGQRMFYFGGIGKGGNDGGAFVLPAGVTGRVGKITDLGNGIKKVEITLDGKWGSTKTKIMTEEQYRKANTWDSFFQKEINSRDASLKTEAPDGLVKQNADFLDNLHANAAKQIVDEIQKASVNGFDEDLAMLVLSRNYTDSAESLDRFVVKQVDDAAKTIAEKMPGGATEENLSTARATLWSDETIKTSTVNLVSNLIPGTNLSDIRRNVDLLFKTQAEGHAAAATLPIDVKDLVAEKKKLQTQLYQSNKYAIKEGKEADAANRGKYVGDPSQVIHYMENGEDVYVVVNDPVVAAVLKRPSEYKEHGQVAELWNMTAKFVAQTYRLGTTGANVPSLVRNFLRDPFQATMSTEFNPLNIQLDPRYFYRTLRGYGLSDATIDKVMNQISTRASASTLTAEMRGLGFAVPGTTAYSNRIQQAGRALEKSLNIKPIEKMQMPLEMWEGFMRNQVGQQAFIRHYKRTGDVDRALGRALLETSNATTDFSHAVVGLRNVTSTIPYLSSAINGARSFGVLFNLDPVGMVARISAGFMMPVMAITAWNLSSDERRKAYQQLPEWYKSTHIVLLSPDGKTKFALSIPEEISNYSTLSRNLIEYTNDVSPYTINMILSRGVFGMLPVDIDGFFADDGSINWEQGFQKMASGLAPQLVTAIWEQATKRDTYTGQSYENLDALNQAILFGSNIFGTGFRQIANDIGMMAGQPDKIKIGLSTAETLSRDLFAMGFNQSKNQFMSMIGNPSKPAELDAQGNKVKEATQATGLFKENEELKAWVDKKNTERATAKDSAEVEKIDKEIEDRINAFTEKVGNLTNRYMQLYSITGGLEDWQKDKIIQILTLGDAWTSEDSKSYQSEEASQAYLNERGLAAQRYVQAGLPTNASIADVGEGTSIALQAALNSFYGAPKQAATDFRNSIEESGLKDIRNEFYSVVNKIYDESEKQGKTPDYDLIKRIQARYLQAVDAALIPVINQYGIGILNNTDFIDTVRKQVSGMIPSDDWKQSAKNAKRYLSSKEFPTTTVDVKKWLQKRYTSGMVDRGLASDQEVTDRLESIRADIDAGRYGSAKGKIEDLKTGVNKANFYISSKDLQTLNELYNMVK